MKDRKIVIIIAVLLIIGLAMAGVAYKVFSGGDGAGRGGAGQSSTETASDSQSHTSGTESRDSASDRTESESGVTESNADDGLAPDITILDSDGNEVSTRDITGRPMIITIWATWCPYCVDELPLFQKAYERYGDKINFVMLDIVDGYSETIEGTKAYLEKNGYTFPVYYDTSNSSLMAYGITGIPVTIGINSGGSVSFYNPGAIDQNDMDSMTSVFAGE